MGAHDGGVEHLKEMRRGTHRGERVEEGFEDASLAQPIHAVPGTEAPRQSAPANVLDGEEMKRLEEAAVGKVQNAVWGLNDAVRDAVKKS